MNQIHLVRGIPMVPVRVDNKAAERSRLYRERHREEVNKRRQETRQQKQNSHKIHNVYNVQKTDEIEQITQATSNNQLRSQHLLYETQSTNSNQSTQTMQDISDTMTETDNYRNTSNSRQIVPLRVDNKAAERSRLYRKRHREEINKRRRDTRQQQQNSHQIHTVSNVQNTDKIEQITQATSYNQLSSQRLLYETQSTDSNQRFHSMMETKTDDSHEERKRKIQLNDSSEDEKVEERNRKNREKCKRYREKKKNEVAAFSVSGPIDSDEKVREEERKQKNREKTRRYRENKKNKNEIAALSMATANSSSDSSGTKMEQARQKQINADKCKRYRDKKRTSNLQTQNISYRKNVPQQIVATVASFRRHDRPAAGVAICKRLSDVTGLICTNHMDVHARYTSMFSTNVSDIVATLKMDS